PIADPSWRPSWQDARSRPLALARECRGVLLVRGVASLIRLARSVERRSLGYFVAVFFTGFLLSKRRSISRKSPSAGPAPPRASFSGRCRPRERCQREASLTTSSLRDILPSLGNIRASSVDTPRPTCLHGPLDQPPGRCRPINYVGASILIAFVNCYIVPN